ncbi:coiled-coil domain-containing protein 157 isoform X2 [Pogoniulus pusillus]|uniref:coiled-coil domain-containing protein 157 isoform X2 n=1 Tax=Pogoniulus pusillus TaxID=488313 RepID=UPI0030B948FF
MAHLGHRGCMESLRADLRDLQAAIGDIASRAGAVRVRSWKFPNRVSSELDMGELLERYSYTEGDPEFTQHCHVVLLELVIDRLLLLLQSCTGYAAKLLSEGALTPVQAAGPSLSVGLTAKRYCCSMLKLGACYQQLLAEKKAVKERPPPQPTPQAETPEKKPLQLLSACRPDRDSWGSSLPGAACSTADSSHSIPTPAAASSLGACDTCASAQASLREVGKAIISICQSQNIPSALSRFQLAEESTGRRALSAVDMSHWASEQSRDLSRICKHLQRLLQQLSPLKAELEEAEKQRDELRRQAEDFSRLLEAERQTQEQQRKEAEQSLAAKSREHCEAIARLEQDKAELQRGAALLGEQFSALKEELAAKQAVLQELVTKTTLLEEMRTTVVAKSQVLELEEKVQLLSSQRESLGQELSSTSVQLEKEKAKVQSILRHEESLQAKLRLLLQHFSSLAQEHEELQGSLGEAEEDKAKLEEQLEESRQRSGQQLRAQQELLAKLQQEKLSLEQSVRELQANISKLEEQTQQLQEQERLLVLFPELHSPAKTLLESKGVGSSACGSTRWGLPEHCSSSSFCPVAVPRHCHPSTSPCPGAASAASGPANKAGLGRALLALRVPAATCQAVLVLPARVATVLQLLPQGCPLVLAGSGNVAEDMEKQLQANSLRMQVLQQDSARLRSALAKLKVAAEQGVLKLVPQSQLCCQLSNQPGRESSGQDTGQPSSWSSVDTAGSQGRAGSTQQQPPSSHWPKPPLAQPKGKPRPCLSFPAKHLVLSPDEASGKGRPCLPLLPPQPRSAHTKRF